MIPTFRPDPAHALLGEPTAWNAWAAHLKGRERGVVVDDLGVAARRSGRARARTLHGRGRAGERSRPRKTFPTRIVTPTLAEARGPAGAGGRTRKSRASVDAVTLEVLGLAARLACADESVLQLHLGRSVTCRRGSSQRSGEMPAPTSSVISARRRARAIPR